MPCPHGAPGCAPTAWVVAVRAAGGVAAERLREIQAREASDHRRYLDLYGVDYHDLARYDLVMETDRGTPEEIAQAIVERARARFANDGK